MQLWSRLSVCQTSLDHLDAIDQDVQQLERLAQVFDVSDRLPELRDTRRQVDALRTSVVGLMRLFVAVPRPTIH